MAALYSMPVPTIGESVVSSGHRLLLHVGAHERAGVIVVLKERDKARRHGNHHLRRHVDIITKDASTSTISARSRREHALVDKNAPAHRSAHLPAQ